MDFQFTISTDNADNLEFVLSNFGVSHNDMKNIGKIGYIISNQECKPQRKIIFENLTCQLSF